MLFSRDDVAKFINDNFEAAWETVRPVPMVKIDFGNGHVITRTLHGNIATYVCASDGQVLDILPGIYTPDVYRDRLDQFRLLASYIAEVESRESRVESRAERLWKYHEGQAAALAKNEVPPLFIAAVDFTKGFVEKGTKAVLLPAGKVWQPDVDMDKIVPTSKVTNVKPLLANDLASWKALAEDTENNETARRLQIHEKLAKAGKAGPEQVKRWLYKEVLHADLDDPYLGLGNVLFTNYPFEKEEKR